MINADRHTIIQILGSIMKNPKILNNPAYNLEVGDFPLMLDKYIFTAIYNLWIHDSDKINIADIISYLDKNDVAKNLMEKENGVSFLQDCEINSEESNFSYYYNKLKKINLLRELQKDGYDISSFYCDDITDKDYEKINLKFEEMTPNDIIKKLKTNMGVLENKFVYNSDIVEGTAVQDIRELLKQLEETPEIGSPLQGEILNSVVRGGRKGRLYLRSASSGTGKAIPNYTKIPTPNGWTTVGEVKVGDYLFDRFGKPTKVLAVYPQEKQKEIYRVLFKSGRVAECCEEHLWSYYSNLNDRNPNKLITTTLRELIDNPKGLKNKEGQYRWSVPINQPVQYSEKTFSVDPYVMGLILGDGSFRYSLSSKSFTFSSTDEELVKAICSRQGYLTYKKNSEYNCNWSFELINQENHKNVWVEDILKDYPELWQLKSENKYIPQEFLLGSIEQRYDLLAGLLDTDGSIDEKGRINFTTASKFLKNNIIELCESLGLTCNYRIGARDKYTTGECYSIYIKASKIIKQKLFKLKRKIDIAIAYTNNRKREEKRDRDSIIKIEATGKFTDMTCFYVDNDEHLFLMNNYISTHNTRSMLGDACYMSYPIFFDISKNKWVSTGNCEKSCFIMSEQKPEEIKTMILSFLTGINEEKILYNKCSESDKEKIEIAIDIMEKFKDNLYIIYMPDPCSSKVKNIVRQYNLQKGVQNFFYDYIYSSPAMLEEYRDLKLAEHVCLRLFTTAIKNLAIELDVFIFSATQLNDDAPQDPKGGFKNHTRIQGSHSIPNLVDFGCIMSRPTETELSLLGSVKGAVGITPNLVTDVYKNRQGRWTQIRIWSYSNLGICRKMDLFVTTADMKQIDDFEIHTFVKENNYEYLEDLYNNGEVVDNTEDNSENISETFYEELEPSKYKIEDNLKEIFEDKEELSKHLKNVSLSELI